MVRPVALSGGRILPVLPPLAPLLPEGGLRRGSVVEVAGRPGATSLALALAAGASRAGSWVAAVDLWSLGPAAAAQLGVDPARLALVPDPGSSWGSVAAALVDGVELVLLRPRGTVAARDARRLTARARERGTALVVLLAPGWSGERGAGGWPEGPDVRLEVVASRWSGVGQGWGHLTGREVDVAAVGRRAAAAPRRARLRLPGEGGVEAVEVAEREVQPAASLAAAR